MSKALRQRVILELLERSSVDSQEDLQRVLALPELATDGAGAPATDGLEARVRGTIVHALLERVDFADPAPPDEAAVRGAAARDLL